MTATDVPSWETVLHAVERDLSRTEALLLVAAADPNDPDEARFASAARLLTGHAEEPALPPLDTMPVLTTTLVDRAQALRTRMSKLRGELELAMSANRAMAASLAATRASAAPMTTTAPRLIDTVA